MLLLWGDLFYSVWYFSIVFSRTTIVFFGLQLYLFEGRVQSPGGAVAVISEWWMGSCRYAYVCNYEVIWWIIQSILQLQHKTYITIASDHYLWPVFSLEAIHILYSRPLWKHIPCHRYNIKVNWCGLNILKIVVRRAQVHSWLAQNEGRVHINIELTGL